MDELTARVIVRLALGGQAVSISENVIRVVGKKEYKEFGKMVNKDSYEKYRDKQTERQEQWDKDRSKRENRKVYFCDSAFNWFYFPPYTIRIKRKNDKQWKHNKENTRTDTFEVILCCCKWESETKPVYPLLLKHLNSFLSVDSCCCCFVLKTVKSCEKA